MEMRMRPNRAIAITVFALLQAVIGCHKQVISVTPFSYPYASPGDYLEWRKANPQFPDFVVVFNGQSPCGSVTTISVNGTKAGKCRVVTLPGSATYSVSYDIYINSQDQRQVPAIQQPPSWPKDIPFNVVGCKVCGSSVSIPGSSNTSTSANTNTPQRTGHIDIGATTNSSNVGIISCPGGKVSVTDVAASISTDQLAIWQEPGPNNGWTITNFQPSSPCIGSNPTSNSQVCILSRSASGPYTFDITANSCLSQPKGEGKLTVNP
jgi:hypothetical protein